MTPAASESAFVAVIVVLILAATIGEAALRKDTHTQLME